MDPEVRTILVDIDNTLDILKKEIDELRKRIDKLEGGD